MPHRYFTDNIQGDTAQLEGQDAHHLARVMRAKLGQTVLVCDGKGTDYTAEITQIEPECVTLSIQSRQPSSCEPSVQLTLFVGYPKQDKLEWIIQKGVELGAVRIVPFFSRYCVVTPKKEEQKNQRYQKIAQEAAKQAGRGVIPVVEMPLTFAQLLERVSQFDTCLLCYEQGGNPLSTCLENAKEVALITGSEGGFTPEEAQKLADAGAHWIGLGPRILRCETAPIAAASAVMTLTGNLE